MSGAGALVTAGAGHGTSATSHFRITARTVLQLGAELISSDGVAFYELVKNGFDAGSRQVHIDLRVRIDPDRWQGLRDRFAEVDGAGQPPAPSASATAATLGADTADGAGTEFRALRDQFADAVDPDVDGGAELREAVRRVTTWDALRARFDAANEISVRDAGRGMRRAELEDAFLTIGTDVKVRERAARRAAGTRGQPILGEKGVGRLSAMRLGSQLLVTTSHAGEPDWHTLLIDWGAFRRNASAPLEDVPVLLDSGGPKDGPEAQGTTLQIWGLESAWPRHAVDDVAAQDFSRFADPFGTARARVRTTYNGESVYIPRLAAALLPSAHATLDAEFAWSEGGAGLRGTIDYRLRGRSGPIDLSPEDLLSVTGASPATLRALGPFRLTLYWWNRGLLAPVESIGDTKAVRDELDRWAGGVAIYRDGFRVAPYGSMADDWLDLDRDAFKSRAYKLNRRQVVAKIDVTTEGNPELRDQTNREGIQETPAFVALRSIVKHVLEAHLRPFLEQADREYAAQEVAPLAEIERASESLLARAERSARAMRQRYPEAAGETEIVEQVDALSRQLTAVLKSTRSIVDTSAHERERLTTLAGIGLMVEVIAHELHRATENALLTMRDLEGLDDPTARRRAVAVLAAELTTLRTRLSVLDELSVSGRQRKSTVDLVDWTRSVLAQWEAKFARHGVRTELVVAPPGGPPTLMVRAVRGMLVQVLSNLLANSAYWLGMARRNAPAFAGRITITVDTRRARVSVADNGPGVPESRAELVFQPFVTTKPPGEGRGLGLYIAREIAKYHGGALYLADAPRVHPDRRNTFVFELGKAATSPPA